MKANDNDDKEEVNDNDVFIDDCDEFIYCKFFSRQFFLFIQDVYHIYYPLLLLSQQVHKLIYIAAACKIYYNISLNQNHCCHCCYVVLDLIL